MVIEAGLCKYKRNNFKIAVVGLILLAGWCAYDGYFNEKWIEEHTNADGTSQPYLVFNRKAPMYLVGCAVLAGVYFLLIRNKKVVAGEQGLIVGGKTIAYDSIEKVDKTYFESKGYFVITYKNKSTGQCQVKVSDRTYDNLVAVLDEVVSKIS